MREVYLDNEQYDRLIDAVMATLISQFVQEGKDALKLALGEIAGIWPASCQEEKSQAA